MKRQQEFATALVISGELGAGKTTAARIMVRDHGFEHLSFVDLIWKPILAERGIEVSRESLQTLGIELVETVGIPGLVDRLLSSRQTDRVIIDDARRSDVVQVLRQSLSTVVHLHIQAGFASRFPRLVRRDGVKSEAEQLSAESVSTETTIAELAEIADLVVTNEGSLLDYERSLHSALRASTIS